MAKNTIGEEEVVVDAGASFKKATDPDFLDPRLQEHLLRVGNARAVGGLGGAGVDDSNFGRSAFPRPVR
jgi:hypothetical protein